ncbi:YfhE family protein [Virgibacillus halophilus]|uniref:YfhE family protein n=1 Tax=Tigheibacillus halophilus TaxID=361280 RepID=A0ABU5CB60_9BACI|nr:YfhE family protein [Virgibacillus halophilus]
MKDKTIRVDKTLNKTQQVLYQKEFKHADKIYNVRSKNH